MLTNDCPLKAIGLQPIHLGRYQFFLANFNNLAYDTERGQTGEYGTDSEEITQPTPRCVYYI